jgi:hypothetical protein
LQLTDGSLDQVVLIYVRTFTELRKWIRRQSLKVICQKAGTEHDEQHHTETSGYVSKQKNCLAAANSLLNIYRFFTELVL